jgi:putative intracellular protease/amidase
VDRRATAFDNDVVRWKLKNAGALRVDDQPVVVDGPIITARHWNDAGGLVDAAVAACHQKPGPKSGK